MARIVTVYLPEGEFAPIDMSLIRWHKMSEALARLGHRVTMASNEAGLRRLLPTRMGRNLRRAPFRSIRWDRFDIIKTEFHIGWTTLEQAGGAEHDFIIAKLGSVVGDRDQEGVYFYRDERRELFEIQQRIAKRARYVTVLSEPSLALWRSCHGARGKELLVPGGVDVELPAAGPNPYAPDRRPVCVFAGNFYDGWSQSEVHQTLVGKINDLGRALRERGVWLHVVGRGDASRVDPEVAVCHGPVPFTRSWDYLRAADVGVVFAFGPRPNHNESTKIYHYLRAGLPTVCEAGFPNENLVYEAGLGEVSPNGDMDAMAEAATDAVQTDWDRGAACELILAHHTWDARARLYGNLIERELGHS